jgi:hypothetical protein
MTEPAQIYSPLATLVASAHVQRLALIGLAKNVGKTTTTNHLLSVLVGEGFYQAGELGLTSLGLDGEAVDALTGLPKPRYMPGRGLLVATTLNFLHHAESNGARFEYLRQLPGRTALGPVSLARVLEPGQLIIAGPTLLRELRQTLKLLGNYGAKLGIIDGAINRLGAAAPDVTDACILCTGCSLAANPTIVARRSVDVLARLSVRQTTWGDAYRKHKHHGRLVLFLPERQEGILAHFPGIPHPSEEAKWIVNHIQPGAVFFLHGALTEELARELLSLLSRQSCEATELVIEDATKIFCHSATIQRFANCGLHLRIVAPIRVVALTINPYTPEYTCTSQQLLEALLKELPSGHPPVIDVISGNSSQKM